MTKVLRELEAIREGIIKINAERQRSQQLISKIDELILEVEDEAYETSCAELILSVHHPA